MPSRHPVAPLPPGTAVEIDRSVRLADEGHVLVGGHPPHALRLTTDQASVLVRWSSGAVPNGRAERVLARRLIDAGFAHPRPADTAVPVGPGTVDVAVVDPTSPNDLARTLDGLATAYPDLRPVVVGATGASAWAARSRGARTVPGPAGGACARNAALGACTAPHVALVAAGARLGPGWLEAALGHFADPGVAAVLPRGLTARADAPTYLEMLVAAVAADRVGPDRGADPAPVLPWGHATGGRGLPGTANGHTRADPLSPVGALVLRRAAVGPDPFDPELGEGAGLDALWRLAEHGWSVRYEPRSRVRVPPVGDLGGYLRACFARGALTGRLARRRGRRAVGPELSWSSAAALALLTAGRPVPALGAVALGAAYGARRLSGGARERLPEAALVAVRDLVSAAGSGGRWVRGAWWPVLAGAAVGAGARDRRTAAAVGAMLVLPHLGAWHRGRGVAPVDPVTWTALGVAGDAARSLGTWWGAAGSRSVAPLLPCPRAMVCTERPVEAPRVRRP
ncbi:family 2 glycosyl transferase [Nocardiopsis sp. FIRDI 009]|uniref:family 2 glycosyl transferase n=1 Tax=Nocardiopsis sp. FIRDI 009 TaxID=714197 RepID=UPI000E23D16A|nr:family 2 glycosyl transferase [Nocardiopsis sp. FIRDI 009]